VQDLLIGELIVRPPTPRESFQVRNLVFGGCSHSPDPGPPRSLSLG
jgi:hypothetical protein